MAVVTRKYDIAPDPTLMEDIGATSFTVAEAISELVANSLDARTEPSSVVHVQVTVKPDEIAVIDDGKGMSADILAEAVRLGVKMDQLLQNTTARKGMFGLGLKTAAASLGRYWELHTRELGGEQEHVVSFDLAEWSRHSGDRDFKWVVEVRSGPFDRSGPLDDAPHGTAVLIRNLRERHPMAGPVLDKLGQAYKPNLESGDSISVNGEESAPRGYDYFEDSRLPVEIDLVGGNHISGWAALDKRTHNDDAFGLNLYRQGQLVEPWNKAWFPVHLMTSRIIGEVHLDFVKTNYFKRGFETQSPEWKLASEAMREFLKSLVKASRDMARNKQDLGRFTRALEGLNRAAGKVAEIPLNDGLAETTQVGGASGGTRDGLGEKVDVAPDTLYLPSGPVRLVYQVSELSSELTPWDYVFDEDARELQAVLNSASKVYLQVKDESFLGTLALADCVASFLTSECGYTPAHAREIRNRWLYVTVTEG